MEICGPMFAFDGIGGRKTVTVIVKAWTEWREDVSQRQHMGQVRWMWKKRERDQCIAEEARSTICAERLIWHEMDIVEMQAGQP